ncbi:MAG: four helix bundle protein [Nitrospirae bacterium]|nr:four helix bundle protein [Nitrospirota bacterium]
MSKKVTCFEDLNVWQKARELVGFIYELTKKKDFARDYALVDQVRRASISIMSNIAEGFERGSNKEFIQFLYIAKGSCGEMRSQLYAALDQQYISEDEFLNAKDRCLKISGMASNLISYLKSSKSFEGKRQK